MDLQGFARPMLLSIIMMVGCAGNGAVPVPEMPSQGAAIPLPDDPHRQFDFWLGEWDVQNKHLRGGDWNDSGTAVALIQAVVDGGAVLEQWNGELRGDPLIGFSLRAYDPELGKWPVYLNWYGGRPGGFSLMIGSRNGESMELFPPDSNAERYTFSLAHEDSCQWDQAHPTADGGWTTDWVMQFTRRQAPLAVDASNAPIRQPPDSAAGFAQTRQLDFLIGAWSGTATELAADGSEQQGAAQARVSSMIEGFGLLQFVDLGWGAKYFAALGHDGGAEAWVALSADNRSDGILRLVGEIADRTVTFSADTPEGEVVERWSCDGDRCRWVRSVHLDGRLVARVTADLERDE